MSIPVPEQFRRERARAIAVASIELVLGVLFVFIGFQLFNFSQTFRIAIYEISKTPMPLPSYIVEIFNIVNVIVLVLGIAVLIHGIKRMIDNVLNAWAKFGSP